MNIIAVDWGKDTRKRSAYRANLATRTVSRLPFDGHLSNLLELTTNLESPVLIGIDAVIGFPAPAWKQLMRFSSPIPENFADFLFGKKLPPQFFDPVTTPDEWSPSRPFIRPPPGSWSRTAFNEASDNGIQRQVDRILAGNPIFITSGLPGSVGSGTRALWMDLIAIGRVSNFSIWPFDGRLSSLLQSELPVIAEIYPKACYGIALADTLPTLPKPIAKTREQARSDAVDRLLDAPWLARERLSIQDIDAARLSEDDFDAMISAVALTRMVLEGVPLDTPETIEPIAEGGVLGTSCLKMSKKKSIRRKPANRKRSKKPAVAQKTYQCPIPGCTYVFQNSRGGWDAHVASLRRHPRWHADIKDPIERKRFFRLEYPDWFLD